MANAKGGNFGVSRVDEQSTLTRPKKKKGKEVMTKKEDGELGTWQLLDDVFLCRTLQCLFLFFT